MTDWFTELVGFKEEAADQVRAKLALEGTQLRSTVNNAKFECGRLAMPTLTAWRDRLTARNAAGGTLRLSEIVGDVQKLHADPENAGVTFQVASQFTLLEMVSPGVTPEQGVGRYEHDLTRGPACAIACGAGTIYRNYFVELDGQLGQTADRQVDCLADLDEALGNNDGRLWEMRNGYALPTRKGLEDIASKIQAMTPAEVDVLRAKLRVGVQSDVQVTIGGCEHGVTRVYASALPVAYCRFPASTSLSGNPLTLPLSPAARGEREPSVPLRGQSLRFPKGSVWEPFAQLVLDAAYEATFCAAALNAARTGRCHPDSLNAFARSTNRLTRDASFEPSLPSTPLLTSTP